MFLAHRIRLDPNNVQATCLARAAGTARFAYNWALAEWQRQFDAYKANPALPKPNEAALGRKLNAIKRTQFPWMLDVTKNAPQIAIMQLGRAFENFFAKRARYPVLRKKGRDDRFALTNDQFRVENRRIRIPKLGWVHMREALRFTGRIVSASISRVAGHWYASITVDTPDHLLPPAESQGAVGVDPGITALATLSTGEKFHGPKALRTLLKRLRRLSRALSRKIRGSRNRAKAKLSLAKLHARIASIRRDSLQFVAGLFEVVWAYSMRLSNGFTHLTYSIITVVMMMASFGLLSVAMRSLPLGTAYTVWTGIGAIGAFIVGVVFLGEQVNLMRVCAAVLIVSGLVLMKLSAH